MSPRRIAEQRPKRHAVLSTIPSDSHTWNLLFLQLLMEENGWSVTNLGACVPVPMLVDESRYQVPDMIVISTVNGHGAQEGMDVITALRAEPALSDVPVLLGGKIDVSEARQRDDVGSLLAAGYDAVLIGDAAIPEFLRLLHRAVAPRVYA
jgi:methylaspartate mutase sigma subunit